MTYEVDTGIQMPDRKLDLYPFGRMSIGDSFAFQSEDLEKMKSAIAMQRRESQKKFSYRKFEGGYRCWRIE